MSRLSQSPEHDLSNGLVHSTSATNLATNLGKESDPSCELVFNESAEQVSRLKVRRLAKLALDSSSC